MSNLNMRGIEDSGPSNDVMNEVRKLISEDKNDREILYKLRNKYDDEKMVDAVYEAYRNHLHKMHKRAEKFKQAIVAKYASTQLEFSDVLRKARKYAKKHNLSDDEFDLFIRMAMGDSRFNRYNFQFFPNTPVAKTLGYEGEVIARESLKVKDSELDVVQDILRLYGETRGLHAQTMLQSQLYQDCAVESLIGRFESGKHSPYSYVHPVVAALFLPKIQYLEDRMIIANMGQLIKTKQEGKAILTKPEYDLYYSLVTDPNDSVCSMDSAIKDLRNRFILQTKLWDNVNNLRQGKYYHDKMTDFLSAIEQCRNNVYDAPDLTYVKDEGTVLRRLLAAFSIRPTIVSTSNVINQQMNNPYLAVDPLQARGINNITTVPIVTLRLPSTADGNSTPIHIKDAFNQPQWYVQGGSIVPRTQQILHSQGVLMFYIGRRYHAVNLTRFHTPYKFTALPMTVAGFEGYNSGIVNFDEDIDVMNDRFQLRSVVMLEHSPMEKKLIVGNSAGIISTPDPSRGISSTLYLNYNPQGVAQISDPNNRNPITYMDGFPNPAGRSESFYEAAATRGTIFIYQRVSTGAHPLFTNLQ